MVLRWPKRAFRWTRRHPFGFLLLLLASGSCSLYFLSSDSSFARSFRFRLKSTLWEVTHESHGFALDTAGCRLTNFDPWMEKSRHFFRKRSPSPCPPQPEDAVVGERRDGILAVDPRSKERYEKMAARKGDGNRKRMKKPTAGKLTCRKWRIHRLPVEEDDGMRGIDENFTEFDHQTALDSEFARVECRVSGGYPVYRDHFYSVPRQPEVERECSSRTLHFLSRCRLPACRCRHLATDERRLSVLVIGVDGVTAANFSRQFPETHRLLTGSDFDAVEFRGYTQLGVDTLSCLLPFLTGRSLEELTSGCWGGPAHSFDNCSTLWDAFAHAGYRTAFVEDPHPVDRKLEFLRRPAHYHATMPDFRSGCWRGVSLNEHVLRWARLFQTAFADDPHFGYFRLSRSTREDVNEVQRLDPPLAALLSRMTDGQLLRHTLLIVASEQGMGTGSYARTEVGRIERRLPFLYVALPPSFRAKYPRATRRLETNGHRLVTAYDLHATLVAIVNCDYGDEQDGAPVSPLRRQRAVSLFRQVAPERTCDHAHIPAPFCACLREDDDTNTDGDDDDEHQNAAITAK